MKIAIASGKGGTGKTTIAVNIALLANGPIRLLDCDVEEPNAHLFLRPTIDRNITFSVKVPAFDETLCDGCGECARFCQFNAIAVLKKHPLVYGELCHACGGCAKVCPKNAIREVNRPIGEIETGHSQNVLFAHGRLRVGEASATALIRAVKDLADHRAANLLDCPPGTACPMVTAVRGADFALLVTEPTPFGLHDLALAVETLRAMNIPFAAAINRHGIGDNRVEKYCAAENIEILARIPDDRRIAESYSRGGIAVRDLPDMRERFQNLLENLLQRADQAQRKKS